MSFRSLALLIRATEQYGKDWVIRCFPSPPRVKFFSPVFSFSSNRDSFDLVTLRLNIYFDCFLLILFFGLALLCEESNCSTAVQEGTRGQNGGESGSQQLQGIMPYCFQ